MKEEKTCCPYCGSKEISLGRITPDILVDPAPNICEKRFPQEIQMSEMRKGV